MNPDQISELQRLQACYRQLWLHVRDVHGIDAGGTAGQIEAVHRYAHRREATPWHDAWTMPDSQQATA